MKKILRLLAGTAVGVVVSIGFTSCYYDPNYSSASVGGTYSSGYGDGYGYGGSGFSTSVFVSTGNPQWGYDPNCYSYYDYRRRCYYDPYLNGYYPIGYRPPVVYGVPHPYGWRAGGGYIRPPVYVKNVTVHNYQNRAVAYQGTNYGWAKQVRQQPVGQGRVKGSHSSGTTNYNNSGARPSTGARPSGNSGYNSSSQKNNGYTQSSRESTRPTSNEQKGKLPSRYNTPVKASDQKAQRSSSGRQQGQHSAPNKQSERKGKTNDRAEEKQGRSNNRY